MIVVTNMNNIDDNKKPTYSSIDTQITREMIISATLNKGFDPFVYATALYSRGASPSTFLPKALWKKYPMEKININVFTIIG